MSETLQNQLGALGAEVQAAALPGECKHTAVWCLKKLPTLYTQFLQTHESRYADEISSLVRGVLHELGRSESACPEARELAATMTHRLHSLHEELGLPGLDLRPTRTGSPRSKASSGKKKSPAAPRRPKTKPATE